MSNGTDLDEQAERAVTPSEFLRELFSIAPGDAVAWVTSFEGDPKKVLPSAWDGRAHDPAQPLPHVNGSCAYFSIAAFPEKVKARRKGGAHNVLVLVLDDVGTKADPALCRQTLGDPSYRIKTSQGNEQWGYLPAAPINPKDLEPLHAALKALKAADGQGINSVRYVRLPCGINGKKGDDFLVHLAEWAPQRRRSLAYFRDRLRIGANGQKPRYTSPDVIHSGEGDAVGAPQPGDAIGRDGALAEYGGHLLRKHEPDQVLEMLRDRNRARGDPPLPDQEVVKIWKSVCRYRTSTDDEDGEYAGVDPRIIEELRALPDNVFVLPNDHVPYTFAARYIFTRMANEHELFVRSGRVVEMIRNAKTRRLALELLTSDAFRSRLEKSRRRVKAAVAVRDQLVLKLKRCSGDTADVLLATTEAREHLPSIALLTRCPVLHERDGRLQVLGPGYHECDGGIMVDAAHKPATVPLTDAVRGLLALLDDFQFATPADKSRAVANFIGPALRMGGLLRGHALVNAVEANESQTGKGYQIACQHAVYNEPVVNIAQREGGVGSLDESIAEAIFSGATFVTLENLRGRIASTYLEALITLHGDAPVRLPHRGEVRVDIGRTTFHLTSNGLEATVDLANRSLITRLLHQPQGYQFRAYPEGALLEHIRANQPHYLGCVFAVVEAWHAAGKPLLPTTHSFVEWVGTLDWIVQKVFELPPLLDGHQQAVQRVTSPALSWLRLVAQEMEKKNRLSEELLTIALVEICAAANIEIPGVAAEADDMRRARQAGIHLSKIFETTDEVEVDTIRVRRIVRKEYRPGTRTWEDVKRYRFGRAGQDDDREETEQGYGELSGM